MKSHFAAYRCLLALVLLTVMALTGAITLAETTSGYARVYGYKDVIERDERKFAPYAVLQDVAHTKQYALRYNYSKANNYSRSWELRLVKEAGHTTAHYTGRVDVYLPYPSIWSDDQQAYWKWTREYCSRFDWTVEKALLQAPYTKTEATPIEPDHPFGFRVSFFDGIPGKRVTIKMVR